METFSPRIKLVLLRCHKAEVSRARNAVRNNLGCYAGGLVDRVVQCTGETVANAIIHALPKGDVPMVTMLVIELEDRVRVEVIDDGSEGGPPRVNEEVEPGAECGRGLFLVEALSDAWGYYVDECGTNVWFEITVH